MAVDTPCQCESCKAHAAWLGSLGETIHQAKMRSDPVYRSTYYEYLERVIESEKQHGPS